MRSRDKVSIGIVNDGKINSQLVIDLLQIATLRRERFDSMIQCANIGLLTRSRNVVVKNFLQQTDAAWLLMIDSDERLTLDCFDKLIDAAHDKERRVISGLVFAAFFDDEDLLRPIATIYRQTSEGLQSIDDFPENEIIEIAAAGTGCLLIHRDVLLLLQEKASANQGKDWAWFVDGAIEGRWFGEDLLFSKRLTSLGVQIYAHTGAQLAHRKEFWLDSRHHAPFREAARIKHESQ